MTHIFSIHILIKFELIYVGVLTLIYASICGVISSPRTAAPNVIAQTPIAMAWVGFSACLLLLFLGLLRSGWSLPDEGVVRKRKSVGEGVGDVESGGDGEDVMLRDAMNVRTDVGATGNNSA